MSKTIVLADNLTFPLDVAGQTLLIVGKRNSGKTSTAVRLAEQLHHAHSPFVVIDPVDVWFGLKAARNGRDPGLSVYVFGGRHADLPLEPTAGTLVADVLVEHRVSIVLSVKHFTGGEKARFVRDLMARLFQRNTEPLHVFLEEAHELAPQQPAKREKGEGQYGEEHMLHHVRRMWKLGRSAGLGGSAITQRPASLHKDITTQAEVLVVHRLIGPQDVAAIKEWIKYHGEREDILGELATLKTGEAFVWAPDFPEGHPIGLRRVQIAARETFDSSRTPKAGETRHEPKALAPVDLGVLKQRMAETVQRAEAADPKVLQQRIGELQRELVAIRKAQPAPAPPGKTREVSILTAKDRTTLERMATKLEAASEQLDSKAFKLIHDAEETLGRIVQRFVDAGEAVRTIAVAATAEAQRLRERVAAAGAASALPPGTSQADVARRGGAASPIRTGRATAGPPIQTVVAPLNGDALQRLERGDYCERVLTVIATLLARSIVVTQASVAAWLRVHRNNGSLCTTLAALRADGGLDGWHPANGFLLEPIPTGCESVVTLLQPYERRVIEYLTTAQSHPPLSHGTLAELLGVHRNNGSLCTALAQLRAMGLVTPRAPIALTEAFYR